MIGPDIIVTVVAIDRNKIRVGVNAPDGMEIFREELLSVADPRRVPVRDRRVLLTDPHLAPDIGGEG